MAQLLKLNHIFYFEKFTFPSNKNLCKCHVLNKNIYCASIYDDKFTDRYDEKVDLVDDKMKCFLWGYFGRKCSFKHIRYI